MTGPQGMGPLRPFLSVPTFAWWDASDASSITQSGGEVSQWSDKSGNGRHLVQSGTGQKPFTGTRTINGLNALDFDGTDDWLTLASAFLASQSSITILAVIQQDAGTSPLANLLHESSTGSNGEYGLRITSAANFVRTGPFSAVDFDFTSTNDILLNWRALIVAEDSGTLAKIGLDSVTPASVSATHGANVSGFNEVSVGGRSNGASHRPFNGLIGEIRVYSPALSPGDLTTVKAALLTKWDVPAIPPMSDNFNRANSTGPGTDPYGIFWSNNFDILSNQAKFNSGGDWAIWNGGNPGINCASEITITSGLSGNILGVSTSWTSTGTHYTFRMDDNGGGHTYQMYKRSGGAYTLLDSLSQTFPSLPVKLRITRNGTALTGQIWNGSSWVTKVSATDGSPHGLGKNGFFCQRTGGGADSLFDDWSSYVYP